MGKSFNRKFAVTIHYLNTGEKERIVLSGFKNMHQVKDYIFSMYELKYAPGSLSIKYRKLP